MDDVDSAMDNLCGVCVDMGTTNPRAWLMRGGEVLDKASAQVGVRDTASDGKPTRLHKALRELINSVTKSSVSQGSCVPSFVISAGMSSSALGLAEVPHVPTPAGIHDLAASSRWFDFPEITDLPVLLIPGVRHQPTSGEAVDADVMRGEETLCLGLVELQLIKPPAVMLSLGSHWKAIQLDADGRIASSVTSLSGEMIHAAQTQTILASSLLPDPPETVAEGWMLAGMREQRRTGLPRALFCVRLLELAGQSTAKERLAFLIGAFIACDLDALVARGMLGVETKVAVAGKTALVDAWCKALKRASVPATALSEDLVEQASLAGMHLVLKQ